MTYSSILYERQGRVATLTLNRPQVLNSLDFTMMEEMLDAIERASKDPEVGVLVLSGTGRAFCAGADLSSTEFDFEALAKLPDAELDRTLQRIGDIQSGVLERFNHPLVSRLHHFEKPVVCAVNGVAAGGGVGLALAADIVVAARSAKFLQVFVPQLGIGPDMGASWFMPRLIGRARALGAILLGSSLSAEQAENWGMIWKCVDDAVLGDEVNAIAARLAESASAAHKAVKMAIAASDGHTLDEQLLLETSIQRERCGSRDFVEGVNAFLGKRKPNFHVKPIVRGPH